MKTLTLNQIKKYKPCANSWESLLGKLPEDIDFDKPLDVKMLIGLVPVRDAVWALRCLENKPLCVEFAIMCAESVLHLFEEKYPTDKRPRYAIDAAKKWLSDQTGENRYTAAAAAANAADAAAYAAAYYAAHAAAAVDAAAAYAAAAYAAAYAYAYAAYAAAHAHDTYNAAAAYANGAEREKQKQFLLELIDKYYGK